MKVSPNKWLINAQAKPSASINLVCFTFGGGGASVYRPWGVQLPANVNLWAVQLPGRENRFNEPFAEDYRDVVKGVFEDLDALGLTNLVLFGHSMGAHFATLTAQQLERIGRNRPRMLIVSGIKPPSLAKHKEWANAPDDELQNHVISLGAMPDEVRDNEGFLEMYMEKIRADYKLYESVPQDTPVKVRCSMMALFGDSDPLVNEGEFTHWRDYAGADISFQAFKGGHFYFQPDSAPLTQLLSDILRRF